MKGENHVAPRPSRKGLTSSSPQAGTDYTPGIKPGRSTTDALKISGCQHQGHMWGPSQREPCTHLHLELIADVASIELGADELELPVEQGPGAPVPVAQEVQHLLVTGHGVHACRVGR